MLSQIIRRGACGHGATAPTVNRQSTKRAMGIKHGSRLPSHGALRKHPRPTQSGLLPAPLGAYSQIWRERLPRDGRSWGTLTRPPRRRQALAELGPIIGRASASVARQAPDRLPQLFTLAGAPLAITRRRLGADVRKDGLPADIAAIFGPHDQASIGKLPGAVDYLGDERFTLKT